MPEIMVPDPLTLGVIQESVQSPVYHRGPQRHVFFLRRWEQPPGIYPVPVCPHYVQDRWWQKESADCRFRFRLVDHQLRTHNVYLFVDLKFPGRQVQIIPLKGHQFSQPKPCREFQKEPLVVIFFVCLDQRPLHGLS